VPVRKNQLSFSAKSKRRAPLPPAKPRNADVRSREYLTPAEATKLRDAAKDLGRHGFRDWLLLMMMYRHGLRVGEVIDLKWDQVDLQTGKLHVNRLKNGDASVHFIEGDELRALRKLQRDYPDSPFVFASERGGPLAARTVHTIVARAGAAAAMKFPVHPHMLRHAKGYQLASKGVDTRAIQAYLGHKNIQHTVLYTKLDPSRFKGFAKD
jgi:type 1 fimbriae regulatory protein FimE